MKAIRLTAAVILAGIVLSPYFVYANEAPASTEAAFVMSDADRSGSISREEFVDYLHSAKGSEFERVHQDFALMDLNKDNQLTLEELEVGEHMYPLAFR